MRRNKENNLTKAELLGLLDSAREETQNKNNELINLEVKNIRLYNDCSSVKERLEDCQWKLNKSEKLLSETLIKNEKLTDTIHNLSKSMSK